MKRYSRLLLSLKSADYHFLTFREYCQGQRYDRFVILRHDVEERYANALAMAKLEHGLGIRGSYYFRFTNAFNVAVIQEIAALGHEVGYHYDDLSACGGDMDQGLQRFKRHLNTLRTIAEVHTICMEGAPRSKYDNKDLWKDYNYRDYGLIGEPYFDADFDDLFYLTDTGRRWDGFKVSVRDKVAQQEAWVKQGLVFRGTGDIIDSIGDNGKSTLRLRSASDFPNRIMFTFHPQRWNTAFMPWLKELVLQNAKNMVKRFLV